MQSFGPQQHHIQHHETIVLFHDVVCGGYRLVHVGVHAVAIGSVDDQGGVALMLL